jgi:hypothetical protein
MAGGGGGSCADGSGARGSAAPAGGTKGVGASDGAQEGSWCDVRIDLAASVTAMKVGDAAKTSRQRGSHQQLGNMC